MRGRRPGSRSGEGWGEGHWGPDLLPHFFLQLWDGALAAFPHAAGRAEPPGSLPSMPLRHFPRVSRPPRAQALLCHLCKPKYLSKQRVVHCHGPLSLLKAFGPDLGPCLHTPSEAAFGARPSSAVLLSSFFACPSPCPWQQHWCPSQLSVPLGAGPLNALSVPCSPVNFTFSAAPLSLLCLQPPGLSESFTCSEVVKCPPPP